MGLRLQLRKAQAEAGDIILLYGDESEALTHPYLARAWALRGADLRVPAPGQAKKVAIIGSLDHVTRQLIVHTSQTKRSRDFIAHLEQLDHLFGPQPGRAIKPVVLVEDNVAYPAVPGGPRCGMQALLSRRSRRPRRGAQWPKADRFRSFKRRFPTRGVAPPFCRIGVGRRVLFVPAVASNARRR